VNAATSSMKTQPMQEKILVIIVTLHQMMNLFDHQFFDSDVIFDVH